MFGNLVMLVIACGGGEDCQWRPDADRDGYGDASVAPSCEPGPQGWVENGLDCYDADSRVRPGAAEICDEAGLDEDCDGLVNDDDDSVTGLVEHF
ncbi:MAG: putative metal-binding motif-containing protein, partial [Myxococcota bacterium]